MCLDTVTNFHKEKTINKILRFFGLKPLNEGYGYKVFIKKPSGLEFEFYNIENPIKRKWLKAKSKNICCLFGFPYESGFHIFESKEQASVWADDEIVKNLIVKKVKYRGIICSGVQGKYKIIVAREIKIL